MFINDDIFGINDFRESFDYIYKSNTVSVKKITRTDYNIQYAPGDFLGVKTKPQDNKEEIIQINIMSVAPNKKKLDKEGYINKGEIEYTACCSYSISIHHMDIIVFLEEVNPFSIKKDEKFKVIMEDEGLYQGQYCFKFFKLVKI